MLKKIIFFITGILMMLSCQKQKAEVKQKPQKIIEHKKSIDYTAYFKEAQQYCMEMNLNQELFILVDLGLHSGLKRFFIYDFKDKKRLQSFLVSHGCGDSVWGATYTREDASVSNQ